jgi:hypothetical protein
MRRFSSCRRGSALLVLAVLVLLAMPAAAGSRSAQGAARPSHGSPLSLEGRLAFWFSEIWLRVSGWKDGSSGGQNGCGIDSHGRCAGVVVTPKNGCYIDPSGRCAPAAATGDNGCVIEPSGRCAVSGSSSKNGCSLDPGGRCAPASATVDNGCGLDPNGYCSH